MEPERVETEQKDITDNFLEQSKIVTRYVQSVLRKNHINPEHVAIQYVRDMNHVWKVESGNKVQLHLKWPISKEINTYLMDFVRLYKKTNLRRPMELIPFMYALEVSNSTRQIIKERFTEKESIILDLLPKNRLRLITKSITVLEDVVTGESIKVSENVSKQGFYGDEANEWFSLSRKVRDQFPLIDESEDA